MIWIKLNDDMDDPHEHRCAGCMKKAHYGFWMNRICFCMSCAYKLMDSIKELLTLDGILK